MLTIETMNPYIFNYTFKSRTMIIFYCIVLDSEVLLYRKSPDWMFYFTACRMLLSKNCVETDYSLISLVLAMVKLVNISCDRILNEVSFVYDKM